tara:strand:+ start:3112 stop:4011 length:900 start_codon:yes stop_codon:yes gene_type:complete
MAIPSAGSSLAFSAIQTEFGGSNPISLSEYYAGGDNVPSGTSGDAGSIPSSGTIAVSQFYGSTNRVAIALTISSTTQSYNIFSNRGGTYSAGNSDVTLTVQAIVGSTGASAIDTGNQWTSGDTVKIINNSQIVGRGGAGGAGGGQNAQGGAGSAGQPAVVLGINTTIQNNGGNIRGGGGGGGGGKGSQVTQPVKGGQLIQQFSGGGGGGGQGQQGGSSGASGGGAATAGQAGSISAAGQGGGASGGPAGTGGSGGGFGQAGSAGTNSGASGGAAGKAINLAGNQVTFEDGSGNVQGAVS